MPVEEAPTRKLFFCTAEKPPLSFVIHGRFLHLTFSNSCTPYCPCSPMLHATLFLSIQRPPGVILFFRVSSGKIPLCKLPFIHMSWYNLLFAIWPLLGFLFYSDVFCGLLLCANLDGVPRIGHLQGEITPTSFFHQGVVVNCRYV